MSFVTIAGNACSDAELSFTPSGAAVANFTVAENKRTKNKTTGEWEDGDPTFFRVNVWRNPAENVANSVRRGDRVIVHGEFVIREYEKDGIRHKSAEINNAEVGLSLQFATANATRVARQGGQPSGGFGSPAPTTPANDPWGMPPAGSNEAPF